MKYIPAPEPSHYGEVFFWAMVVLAVGAVLGFVIVDRVQRKENRNLPAAIMASLIVAALALLFGFSARGMNREANESQLKYWKMSSIRFEALDSYGIDLVSREIDELRYPKERPTVPEKTFGTLERNVDAYGVREKQEVTLLWRDGKMILTQRDGDGQLSEINRLPVKYQPRTEALDLVRPLYDPETSQ